MIKKIGNVLKNKAVKTVLNPLNEMVDENITDITTTIGSFIIRSIRGKFQRSITFTVGMLPQNNWMDEALYGILYEYNDIKAKSKLELTNHSSSLDGSGILYILDDGTHNLKYRKWNILLFIQTKTVSTTTYRSSTIRSYTIITYDLDPEFCRLFEKDMIRNRNSLLKIKADSPTLNIYKDYHEPDGWTYWDQGLSCSKRKLSTLYLPYEQKKKLVDTINFWFASKELYKEHGIPWNLKILLYGPHGSGKSSIVKVIASEWNRNIYEVTGGKNGKFIPNSISDFNANVSYPLYSISDIDKYPMVINEPDTNIQEKDGAKESALDQKQVFGNMLNALDGVASGEGKIIVMTTNHIEKFSETFLRPGRVDLCMEIGYVVPEVFRKYVYDFYNVELPEDIKLVSNKLTIAELQKDVVFMKLSADEFIKKYVK